MRKCCLNKETFSLENSLFPLVNTTLDFQMSTVLKTNVSEKSDTIQRIYSHSCPQAYPTQILCNHLE